MSKLDEAVEAFKSTEGVALRGRRTGSGDDGPVDLFEIEDTAMKAAIQAAVKVLLPGAMVSASTSNEAYIAGYNACRRQMITNTTRG